MGNTEKLTTNITRNERTGLKERGNLVGGALSPDLWSGGGHVTEGHQSGVGQVAEGHQSDGGHVAEGHQRALMSTLHKPLRDSRKKAEGILSLQILSLFP